MGTKCIVGDEDFALALRDWTGRIAEIVQTPAENGGRWALVGIKRRGAATTFLGRRPEAGPVRNPTPTWEPPCASSS